jgi:hypothetical protein
MSRDVLDAWVPLVTIVHRIIDGDVRPLVV